MEDIQDMQLLSVDDNALNLQMVEAHAQKLNLQVKSYSDAPSALASIIDNRYDLVITDYMMPEMDGLEFTTELRKVLPDIPIIMLTAVGDSPELHLEALSCGCNDFLTKPINSGIFRARVVNLLRLRKAQSLIENKAALLESEVRKATALMHEREKEALHVLGRAAEYRDPETGAHIARVAWYSKMLAESYGLSRSVQEVLFHASPFHDLGKVGIPDAILLKPGKLTDEEMNVIKTHPQIGYDILKECKSVYLSSGGIIALTHHEKFDGSGYPKGLKGDQIPILGRIVAICDVFDALTSFRPYKPAWSIDDALEFLKVNAGTHFDPHLVELFCHLKAKIIEIHETYQEG